MASFEQMRAARRWTRRLSSICQLLMIGRAVLRASASGSGLGAPSFEYLPVGEDWTRGLSSICQLLMIGRAVLRACAKGKEDGLPPEDYFPWGEIAAPPRLVPRSS